MVINPHILPNNLENVLKNLASAEKKGSWITKDLSIQKSSIVGRLFWRLIKHFDCLRERFFGINLEQSKKLLEAYRMTVEITKNQALIDLYDQAVNNFNEIAPRHSVKKIAGKISVGTYNILFPQNPQPTPPYSTTIGYGKDSQTGLIYQNADFRIPLIKANIEKADLDVICLQEVVQDTFAAIEKHFGKTYQCLWINHPGAKHGVGILYKKHKFTQLKASSFNFSFNPVVQANAKPLTKSRVHLVVDLEDNASKKICRLASCHLLDPRDFDVNQKGQHVKAVVDALEETANLAYKIDSFIMAGDMNQDEWGDINQDPKPQHPSERNASCFTPLISRNYQVDGDYTSSEFDKQDYGDSPIFSKNRRIDWIWAKEAKPAPLPLSFQDERGSDHRLVASTIVL